MNASVSIYIPQISASWTEEQIKNVFTSYGVGTVSYIDFVPLHQKRGFYEENRSILVSAFVHFIPQSINRKCRLTGFWETIESEKPYKLHVCYDVEYWICLKNKNPVKRTRMNIHQVVDNGLYLQNLVLEQAELIEKQAIRIEELEKKVEGTHQVVYQLVGGLFNQSSQSSILEYHLENLFSTPHKVRAKDSSKWRMWPTTHQGDECEKKIAELEERLKALHEEKKE